MSDGLGGLSGGVRLLELILSRAVLGIHLLELILSRAQLLLKAVEGRLMSCLELAPLLSAPTRLHFRLSTQLRISSLEDLDSRRRGFE